MSESTSNPTPNGPRPEPDATSHSAPGADPGREPGADGGAAASAKSDVERGVERGVERRAGSGAGSPAFGHRSSDGMENRRRRRAPDRMLALLLLAAERDIRIGLTVDVGGGVVTGTLIGTLAYCRALADQFVSTTGNTEMDEGFAESFRDLVDDAAGIARGDRRHPPDAAAYEQSVGFLHLEDARYVTPAGLLPQGRHGVLWRCPVSAVSSWSVGDLIP